MIQGKGSPPASLPTLLLAMKRPSPIPKAFFGRRSALAFDVYGIRGVRNIKSVAYNIKLYIQQAGEFYEAAKAAKASTAPLIYYYSFLNLAKALCETRNPRFHKYPECYRHGISWRPNPSYLVNLEKEKVSLVARGVWHVLWESISRRACPAVNPLRLSIKQLFLYCPEITIEVLRVFGSPILLLDLVDPVINYDEGAREAWLRFAVKRSELRFFRLSANTMMGAIRSPRSGYKEVRSNQRDLRSFESDVPALLSGAKHIWDPLAADIRSMNVFCSLGADKKISYALPIQSRLPFVMPQIMVLYTILFWFGSLVRYDPHSVGDLRDSQGWILLDGFMSSESFVVT